MEASPKFPIYFLNVYSLLIRPFNKKELLENLR
jgi:hypothetical protein